MSITCAIPADIPALVDLVNLAYRGEEGWTNESHLLSGARTNAADLALLMAAPKAMILQYKDDQEQIIGCVYLEKQAQKIYLGMLSVLPSQQGRGVGKDLLSSADTYAREKECDRIHITVISVRAELIGWYERHGYERTGEMKPFHAGEKFGLQKQSLELVVLEKEVNWR